MKRLTTFLASLAILWLPFALACAAAIPSELVGLVLWLATGADIRCLRDPTRGGLAATLN